jgi:hypothetical protein
MPSKLENFGRTSIPITKDLVYKRNMKTISCKIDISIKFIAGVPKGTKELEYLESLGIKTVEDLFLTHIEKIESIDNKSFRNRILAIHQKVTSRKYLYEESFIKGKKSIFNYLKELLQIKHLNHEEKAIIAGLAIFSPILKVTRRSILTFKAQLPFIEGVDFHSLKKKDIAKTEIRKQKKMRA